MSGAIAFPSSSSNQGEMEDENGAAANGKSQGKGGARGSKAHQKKGGSKTATQQHTEQLQQKGDENNLKPGTHVMAQWRDKSWRKAIVIERG